jgi:hypothetical protein
MTAQCLECSMRTVQNDGARCTACGSVNPGLPEHEEELRLIRVLDMLQGGWATGYLECGERLIEATTREVHEITAAWR